MATTKQIAEQLHKLAEHIETLPDTEAGGLYVMNVNPHDKEIFKVQASMMPRPITKSISKWSHSEDLQLEHDDDRGIRMLFSIDRKYLCKLISPAREAEYECEPIFSTEEENAL